LRHYQQLPSYEVHTKQDFLTLQEAAQRLGVSSTTVRRMIKLKLLPANQVIAYAPWQIPTIALASLDVKRTVQPSKQRVFVPRTHKIKDQHSLFSKS
jgi:hypothetical protein